MSYKKTGSITPEIKSYDWLKPNLKPSSGGARDKLTFKRTRESFEEQEIQSKVCFRAKISKKKYFFFLKVSTLKFKPGFLDGILHQLTAKTSWITVSYSKYYTSLNVPN
jgi:hypothetical protein